MMPRTFGDLITMRTLNTSCRCSFCKRDGVEARKYSTRHYVCDACIAPRAATVLPAIARREAFNRRMEALK